jgi:hypothetical protein
VDNNILSLTPRRMAILWSYKDDGNVEIIAVNNDKQEQLSKFYEDELSDVDIALGDSASISLNSTGTKIWELCDGIDTVEDILNKLSQEFQVKKEELLDDFISFLNYCDSLTILDINWRSVE